MIRNARHIKQIAADAMGSDERPIVDWINLPEGANELSLWSTLHDGDLTAIESDLLTRTVTLRFDVPYLRTFHNFSEGTRFVAAASGVQSVRSFSSVPWLGGCLVPAGIPYEEQQTIVAEYHRKWREESLSWTDFERLTEKGMEVPSATLVRGSDGIALRFGVFVDGGSYMEAYIRGEDIAFSIGERQVTPEEFVAVGEAYWEVFAKKARQRANSGAESSVVGE